MITITTLKSSCAAMHRNRRYTQRSFSAAALQVLKSGTAKYGQKHRSCMKSLKNVYQKIGDIRRYYYKDEEEFQSDLDRFNRSLIKTSVTLSNELYFVCVGLANVRLQFCSKCFDVDKENEMDLYYVNKGDVSQQRTTLCRGCLGNKLQERKREKGSTETLV